MQWLYAVIVGGGTLATQLFPTEEACQGHKVVFDRGQKVSGACFKMPQQVTFWYSDGILTCCDPSTGSLAPSTGTFACRQSCQ